MNQRKAKWLHGEVIAEAHNRMVRGNPLPTSKLKLVERRLKKWYNALPRIKRNTTSINFD